MQDNSPNSTVINLVCDENFIRHHLAPTQESIVFWDEWLRQNPSLVKEWNDAENLIQTIRLGLGDYAQTYLSKEAEEQLLVRIQNTIDNYKKPVVPIWQKTWAISSVAACVLLLLGVAFWYVSNNKNLYEQQIADLKDIPLEKINNASQPLLINLPDGSTVMLASQSILNYGRDFGKVNRNVFLRGEATFEVIKNPSKPFCVYANKLVTKVLGTKFTVKAFEDTKEVVVRVEHGQVSVYQNQKANQQVLQGVLLRPNQQVVFVKETEKFTKTIVDEPILLPTESKANFVFDETAISVVFTLLEKSYGIEMIFNKDLLKKCQLTASLNGLSFFQQLDIITQSIGASYNVVEGKVIISTQGCNK